MELLIWLQNLIFDNLFIVVIIFAALSFLRRKVRELAEQGRERQSSPNGTGMPAPPQHAPVQRQSHEVHADARRPELSPTFRSEPMEDTTTERPLKTRSVLRPQMHSDRARKRSNPPALHSNHAVQGMMWAEVFGQPRALRPHRQPHKRI